ncbi:MAG: chemotaxis-specific protein-glutamate methyltransferase CheB [Candidatus Methanoperedens sp.]|nr:chemotaxis-specific protein-glutamate methyltransferase CheB [Candidatus Methanoperedens sp.]
MNESTKAKIKVLVVDDSPVAQELLIHILSSDPGIEIIGTASNGEDAIKETKHLSPDVITMDIHMPKMDGYEATRRIMETCPVPIVIVTGSTGAQEVSMAMRVIEAGALAFVQKPRGIGHPDYQDDVSRFIQTVKLMSEVKVVRRRAFPRRETNQTVEVKLERQPEIQLVAIGASTGGPPVLQTILSKLPGNFPVPVLIVQHMAAGFIQGFMEWLGQTSSLPVHVATHGEFILPGHVYLAPDGFAMKPDRYGRISLARGEIENGLCPSVSYLFRSVAEVFGKNAVGILLTGMGKDGAEELKLMKEKGAITIAQDKESSVVHGMPGEAINLDAAMYVLSPEKIAAVLSGLVNNKLEMRVVNL